VRNGGVDKVSFTGSTAVGKRIASICGERMARYTVELGGKSAALVLQDFPIAVAAKMLARAAAALSGQICALTSRAIVHESVHDQLAAAIAEEMRAIRVGYS